MKNTLSLKLFRTENIPNTFLFFSLFLLSNSHLHKRLPPSLHFLPLLDPRSFSPDPQTQRFSLWLCVFFKFWKLCGTKPLFTFSKLSCLVLGCSAWYRTPGVLHSRPSIPPAARASSSALAAWAFLGSENILVLLIKLGERQSVRALSFSGHSGLWHGIRRFYLGCPQGLKLICPVREIDLLITTMQSRCLCFKC